MSSIKVLKDLLTQQKLTPLIHSQVCCFVSDISHEVSPLMLRSGPMYRHHSADRDGDVCGKGFLALALLTCTLLSFPFPHLPSPLP